MLLIRNVNKLINNNKNKIAKKNKLNKIKQKTF